MIYSEAASPKFAKGPSLEVTSLLQPKLTINTPGDVYEQEADAMADRVMRMTDTSVQNKPVTGLIGTSVQRKCAECEEEEKKAQVMRKAEGGGYNASPSLVSRLSGARGNGTPLSAPTRNFMEAAFSTDFSNVRVHTGNESAEMSKGINAKAFTYGNDVYFNSGAYQPETQEGKRLLAHELTHVVQQGNILPGLVQRDSSFKEKWDDFIDVGPTFTYIGYHIAMDALKAAEETGLPGLHNGPGDAWRHCYWNCSMTQEFGPDRARKISSNHEKDEPGPAIETQMDLYNNAVGYSSCDKTDCDACCQGKLDTGKLKVIDPVTNSLIASSRTARKALKKDEYKY
jgi:hypothetical protein